MRREFDHLSKADMQAWALARAWGISVDREPEAQLPEYSAGPLREVSKRQVRDRDGKTWGAKDAGQLFAQSSFVDRGHK